MSILEIAKMYPEQIGADVVIENSNIANKEKVLQQIKVPTAHGNSAADSVERTAYSGQEKKKLKHTKDFVNTVKNT
jgi:hypothetical protein